MTDSNPIRQHVFVIKKMDCPSEEAMIRSQLDGILGIKQLVFDIPNRQLTVLHTGEITPITKALAGLNLGSELVAEQAVNASLLIDSIDSNDEEGHASQRKLLWTVLAINFTFFVLEMTTGLVFKSMGLVADSLDMLADSVVYGLSLMAVGQALTRKKQVARLAGYVQIGLAILGFVEVVRRFMQNETLPDPLVMMGVSVLALIANATCLLLMQRSQSKREAHIKASMIFTSNDIIINFGVVVAGALVWWTQSGVPDLLVGTVVFMIVLQGARRILKLGR